MATYLTQAGISKLEAKLKDLSQQKRQLSQEVEKARAHGDLRENAEYQAAKERLAQVMERIGEIQFKLSNVQVVDTKSHQGEVATLGTCVTVKEKGSSRRERYILVGPDESDPANGRISAQSPLGQAILGRKVNEEVAVHLPAGSRALRILSIGPAE